MWTRSTEPELGKEPAGVGNMFVSCRNSGSVPCSRVSNSSWVERTDWDCHGFAKRDREYARLGSKLSTRKHGFSMQRLARRLSETCAVEVIWVPSHCGLHGNDVVLAFAKEALNLPIVDQVEVPMENADVGMRVSSNRYANLS